MPKFIGHTKQAKLTQIKADTKQLENASERYYMDKQDWPRLSDTAYTSVQISTFAQEIKDKTGQVVTLDSAGSYYDVDYTKLQQYVQKPNNDIHYIIQNPVGEVFYLDGLTITGQKRLSPNNKPTAIITMTPEQNIDTSTNIIWNYSNSTDIDADNIINAEWQNKQNIYATAGNYTIQLRVQDSKGDWSDWVSKNFNVSVYVPNLKTFSFTGAEQSWTVPANITSLQIETYGAQGMSAGGAQPSGGNGGYAKGNFAVTPGQKLYIYVGGTTGYNGGGTGRTSDYTCNGGGGTDVRTVGGLWNNSAGLN